MATVIFHCKVFKVDNTLAPLSGTGKTQFARSQKIKIEKKEQSLNTVQQLNETNHTLVEMRFYKRFRMIVLLGYD